MAVTEFDRQANRRQRLRVARDPVSRLQKLSKATDLLLGLRLEAQTWLEDRPDNYTDQDQNADKVSEMEEYIEALNTAIEALEDIAEVPRFQSSHGRSLPTG